MLLRFSFGRVLFTTALMTAFFVAPFLVGNTFADGPKITSLKLNGEQKSITFNPNNGESVSIEVQANEAVKFTRLYICSLSQACTGSSGNYTRYFTSSDIAETLTKSWNGKTSGDASLASAGEYKIMVSMLETGANSSVSEFGAYSIFVDYSSVGTTTSTTTGSTSTSTQATTTQATSTTQTSTSTSATTSSQVITNTIIRYVSTHSNPEDLSNYLGTTKFEISAGRERVGYVGTPVKFSAKNNSSKIGDCSSPNYVWIFGDGSKDVGENNSHTYKFPGEYNVILNGVCGSEVSISRTKITVLNPEVVFGLIPSGDLEVSNFGKTEINIGDWVLQSSSTKFVFPEDTIISANGKMILSKEYSKINAVPISLLDPSQDTVFSLENNREEITVSTSTKIVSVEVSKEEVEKFTTAFLQNNKKENLGSFAVAKTQVSPINNQDTIVQASSTKSSGVATVLESTNSLETKGFWRNLFGLPAKGIRAVAKVFYEVE